MRPYRVSVGDAVRAARARLIDAGIPEQEAALDAAGLAMQALTWDRATLLAHDRDPAPPRFTNDFEHLLRRRQAREPMAYIRGSQEFWGRDFMVSAAVLIPRPETELLIEEALRLRASRYGGQVAERDDRPGQAPSPLIVDVGTGSGCLAVTLACEWPEASICATDISEDALVVARQNARRWNLDRRIRFHLGAYLAGIDAPVDLIVANPPYVAETDRAALPPEVRDHEPEAALFGGADGLREVRAMLPAAAHALAADGRLLMEIGAGQADAVREAVRGTPGLSLLDVRADLQGIPRAAIVRKAPL